MRKLLLLTLIVMPASFLLAQVKISKNGQPRKKCYTSEYLEKLQKKSPSMETTTQFEQWMSAQIKQKHANPTLNDITSYTPLPIIFHIIYNNQAEGSGYNVSQALIQAQLRQINKDFANLSGSPYGVASNTGLQFCLAAKDPGGVTLAQPGIDRISTTGKSFGKPPYSVDNFDSKVKPATIWNPAKYINVWVTVFTDDEGILGYSTFPASSTLSGLDNSETSTTAGVAIDYTTVGSIGNPSVSCANSNGYNTGKTLTHELGHFFGLRHIWGDATCGNDYCGDTPVHEDANFGAPTHPKPNSCGTADEMFENFMDYCDDRVLNTFTLNQAERMQVVMINSPRRKELPTSTAGCASSQSVSKIGFTPCEGSMSVSERNTSGTCTGYTDIKLYLNIEDKATAAATLNFTTSGTATKDVDYQIINPTIAVAAGDGYKQLVVRIFDDAAKESDETVIINYTISGSGVTASTTLPQTFTLTIADDDNIAVGQNTRVLYSEDFGTSGGTFPSGWSTLAAGGNTPTNQWVVSTHGGSGITGQSLHITNNATTKPLSYTIEDEPGFHIAETPLINPGQASKLTLSVKYKVAGEVDDDGPWDYGLIQTSLKDDRFNLITIPGTSELVGTYDAAKDTVYPVNATLTADLPASLKGKQFYLNFYWENDDNTGSQPPLVIDDIVLKATPTPVESQLNHSKSIRVMASDSNFIVSQNDDQIIAAISNSSVTIDCLNASIQEAGTSQVAISTSTGNYQRSQKVIKLSPSTSSNATYTATFYFTTAELANWPDIASLKVMKVQDGVSLSSVLTSANAVLLTPVVKDNRTADGYASFSVTTTGFSQFFLVSSNTVLPLQLITFNATASGNGASLNWTTGNEFSNKGFNIQKSLDGNGFSTIAFVDGNRTTTAGDYSYAYFDSTIQPGITYYYRLEQVNIDGKSSYSPVRNVRLAGTNSTLVVYPNPTKNTTHVVTGKNMVASANLTDVNGKTVWKMAKQTISPSGFEVPMKNLPPGIYMLWIQENQARQSVKIVKE